MRLVGLGIPNSGGPTINSTLVTAIATFDFYLGLLGLNPRSTNLTNLTDTYPSFMSMLYDANLIPSISYTYSAGAMYRPTMPLGTLILGGYDESLIESNSMSFAFLSDQSRDLTVGIQAVTASYTSTDNSFKEASLLPSPILSFIDSTTAHIWLPVEACKVFEDVFGLVYDNATDLYLVDEALHNSLLKQNPSISFLLGQTTSGGSNINITLPYAAFDLSVTYPIVMNGNSYYFPLRRAANDTQYTLGRTFLQEAVLTADFGRSNFSLAQRSWNVNAQSHIVTILPLNATSNGTSQDTGSSNSSKKNLSLGALIGIAVGVVAITLLSVGCVACFFHKRKKKQWQKTTKEVHAQVLARQEEKDRSAREQLERSGSTSTATGHSAATFEKPWGGTLNSSVTELPSPDRYAQTGDRYLQPGDRYPQMGYQNPSPSDQYAQLNQQFVQPPVDRYGQAGHPYARQNDQYAQPVERCAQTDPGSTGGYSTGLGIAGELDWVEAVPLAELEAPEVLHELEESVSSGISPNSARTQHNSMRKSPGMFHSMGFGRNRDPRPSLRPPPPPFQQHNERQPWYSWVRGDDRASRSRWGRRSQAVNQSRPQTGTSSIYTSTMTPLPKVASSVYTPMEKSLGSTVYSPRPPTRGKQDEELSPLSPLKNVCYKDSKLDRKRAREREQRDQWERENREREQRERDKGGGGGRGGFGGLTGFI